MQEIITNTQSKIDSAITHLNEKLGTIIATGASPAMLKNVEIEYYEVMTPINQVANIKAPDATMIIVTPFEKSIVKAIVEAINKANLGLNPVDEGDSIRIMVPPMTSEKREIYVKEAKQIGEEARISVRNVRTDSNKKIKAAGVSENEERQAEEDVQKIVDQANKTIEEIVNKKVTDLTTL